MHVRTRARLRAIASTAAVTLVTGAATVLGSASPASATTLSFDCNVPVLGAQTFSATITSNAPSTLTTGSTTRPRITTVMTVPASLADTMRSLLGVTSLSGTIHSTTLVNGVAKVVDLAIPSMPAGDAGTDVLMQATGVLAPITAGMPGTTTTLGAGPQDVVMQLVNASGTSPFDVPCTPTAGQNTTLGKITSVKDGSRTTTRASYNKRRHSVHGTAVVRSQHGIVKATGKVRFVLKRGSHRVASMTRSLIGGKAVATFKRIRRTGRYSLTASYAGSSRLHASSRTVRFRVRR